MEEKTVSVPNISCGNCTATIERELIELDGVESVQSDVATKKVTIRFGQPALWIDIENLLEEIGFPAV